MPIPRGIPKTNPERPSKSERKDETTTRGRAPSSQTRELGYGARPWPSPASTGARPSDGRPPQGQGTPCRVLRQPLSTMSLDVLTCLDDQTTSESYETRTVVFVSKIASQRFENHID